MSNKQTISVSVESPATEKHSLRQGTLPKSVEPSLLGNNVFILASEDKTYRELFNEYFEPYIDDYNKKQKRRDRRWSYDYYGKLTAGGQVSPIESILLQVGNRDSTCGITDSSYNARTWRRLRDEVSTEAATEYVKQHLNTHPNVQTCREILEDAASRLTEWYKCFVPVSIVIHMDEPGSTPHMDVNGFFIAHKNKRGLDVRCAQEAALIEMGFDGSAYGSPFKDFTEDYKNRLAEVAKEHGIERLIAGSKSPHKKIATYRMEQEREDLSMVVKELKRKAEVARMNETEQATRIEELKDEEQQLEKTIKKKKKKAAKATERAEAAEERASIAEKRLEQARDTLNDVRDDISDLRELKRELEDEVEEKKREASFWQKKIEELKAMFIELKEKLLAAIEKNNSGTQTSPSGRDISFVKSGDGRAHIIR